MQIFNALYLYKILLSQYLLVRNSGGSTCNQKCNAVYSDVPGDLHLQSKMQRCLPGRTRGPTPVIKNATLFTRTHQGASLHFAENQLDSFAE